MTTFEIVEAAKVSLGLTSSAYDQLLEQMEGAARAMITREGVRLENTIEDDYIVIMYMAYLFRKRAEDNPVMPRPLRWALNNRLMAQKGGSNGI